MPRRANYACDPCRLRKVKCDSEDKGQPCPKCVVAEIECSYTYQRKKRKPNVALPQGAPVLESPKSLVQAIIAAPESFIIPQEAKTLRQILVSIARYARSLENALTGPHALMSEEESATAQSESQSTPSHDTSTSVSPPSDSSDDEEPDDEAAVERYKQFSLGHSQERYFGNSSNFRFLHNVMNFRKDKVDLNLGLFKRPDFWSADIWRMLPEPFSPAYNFPEDDLLWQLIHIYFGEISPYFPLLHKPSFKRAVAAGLHLHDRGFGAVVLAVCALGARNSDDPRNLTEDTELTAGWRWFRQIRLLRSNFIEPTTLYELQLYCLVYAYVRNTSFMDSTWVLGGLGVRLAQDIGIHRLKPGSAKTAQDELCIRAFWMLWNLDTEHGLISGRPAATVVEDIDLDEPTECDDQYWEKSARGEAFSQPQGEISILSFFKHYTKLMKIAASVQRTIYSIKTPVKVTLSATESNRRLIMEHDSALNNWLDSLPEHLRWDPHALSETFLNQSAILYSSFYWVQLQVHKKFLILPANSAQTFPSLAICANAARSTVRIVQVQHRRSSVRLFELGPKLAHSSTTLILLVWRSMHVNTPKSTPEMQSALSDVKTALNLLADFETRSQTIGRIVDKTKAFIAHTHIMSDMDLLQASAPVQSLKRNRESYGDGLGVSHDTVSFADAASDFEPHISRTGITSGLPEADYREIEEYRQYTESQSASQIMSEPNQDAAASFTQQLGQQHSTSEMEALLELSAWSIADSFVRGPSDLPNAGLSGVAIPLGSNMNDAQDMHSQPSRNVEFGSNAGSEFTAATLDNHDGTELCEDDWATFMRGVDDALLSVGY